MNILETSESRHDNMTIITSSKHQLYTMKKKFPCLLMIIKDTYLTTALAVTHMDTIKL